MFKMQTDHNNFRKNVATDKNSEKNESEVSKL